MFFEEDPKIAEHIQLLEKATIHIRQAATQRNFANKKQ